MQDFTDVVVVGAGASGLHLANLLIESGLSVVVLEASDHIGGRLQTIIPGVDLGATWFWSNESEVHQLISKYGLQSFSQFSAGNMMYQGPHGVAQMEGNPLDHQAQRIVGGMQEIARVLLASLPEETVKMSTTVRALECRDQIRVSTNQGDWVTRSVVIALAPSTAIATIQITPELPKDVLEVAARTPVWMGGVTKVVALYEKAFWRLQGLAGSAISHVGPMREIHDISDLDGEFGALFGFSPTPVTREEVLNQLVEIFGSPAQSPQQLIIKNWRESKFISPPNVSELTEYQLFGSPYLRAGYFDSRFYFTSTETAEDAPGHIQGALSAARRTAAQILKAQMSAKQL